MPRCPELSPYPHASLASAYAVGWLARGDQFLQGDVSERFLEAFRRLERECVHPDGYQEPDEPCALCTEACTAPLGRTVFARFDKGWLVASPRLRHYIDAHRYLPPMEFIYAVVAVFPAPGTPDDIVVLEDLDSVRFRPGMYWADGRRGALDFILGPALDLLSMDDARPELRVASSGGGFELSFPRLELPVEERAGRRSIAAMVTALHGATGHWAPSLAILNGASRHFAVTTTQRGQRYGVQFLRGRPLGPMQALGPAVEPGTTFSFELDPFLFDDQPLTAVDVELRLLDLALMAPRVDLSFEGRRITAPIDLTDALSRRCPADALPIRSATLSSPADIDVAFTICPTSPPRIDVYVGSVRDRVPVLERALSDALARAAPTALAAATATSHLVALVQVHSLIGASFDSLRAALERAVHAACPAAGPWWDAVLERAGR